MEAVSQKSVHGGGLLKDEIKRNIDQSSSGDDDEGCSENIVPKGPIMPKVEISSSGLQATVSSYQKNQEALKSAKAEMGEVMEENQRLKMYLDKIMKDYRALQMQFRDTIVQQEVNNPSSRGTSVITTTTHDHHHHHHHQEETDQESDDQFVSLSLGRTNNSSSTDHHHHHDVKKDDSSKDGQLTLGLDCKLELPSNEHVSPNPSPEPSSEEVKEDTNAGDQKGTKTMRTDDEVSQQNPVKRARVSVRVRCDTPTMNDGCQWRKYGQKIAKGNPCPRAYYRCTVAPNCPVRKQVQRCAEDMSILITTYEGTHNHPLPISATAMASTTSAAACMLMSGSSTSGSALTQSATTNNTINGLNFYLSDNNSIKPKPFYNSHLPNSSISSSSTSFPTITLDLTTNSLSSSAAASSQLNKLGNNFPPRFSTTTNLNFSSLESSSLPISWSNGVLSYGNQYHQSHNKSQNIGSLSFGRQQPIQENLHLQSYLQKNNILNSSNQLQPETLAAATKAITSDPNFQSALAAALTTIISNSSSSSEKLSESFPVLSSFPTASANNSNTNKCAPSFLNYKPPSSSSTTNSQPAGSLMFTSSPSLPFSTSNSKSTSPAGDHSRDHIS